MSNDADTITSRRNVSGLGFDLRITDDFMAIVLSCTVPPRNPESLLARIRAELANLGVADDARIHEAMARLNMALPRGPVLEDVVLLEGLPPKPPVDETIAWGGNFHAKGFVIDPVTGRADYRRTLADVSVVEGQLLATVMPGRLGENGYDVFGRMVPAREPKAAAIKEGKNVRFAAGASEFYAEKSGRVRFVGTVLAVDDVFHIKGDAGLRTGNIDHPGALVVERDIQSGTIVRASGDIDVGENVEDATVESGGTLTVHGGISCKERGTIRVAGNLQARFIRNADIIAGGDVYVDREINQCNIRTRGSVIVKQGRIVGGSIMALKGIETNDLGSDGCIPGEFTVGKDYTMEAAVEKRKAELDSTRDLLLKLRNSVAPLRAKRDSLTPRLEAQLAQLTEELEKREGDFKKQEQALQALYSATRKAAVSHIYVHATLHPDNLIQVGAQVKKIGEAVPGPLRLSLRKGKFAVFKLKPGESLQDKF